MYQTPDQIYGELFIALHESGIWEDGKVISDAIPKARPEEILERYREQKEAPGFDLKSFFERHFEKSASRSTTFESDTSRSVREHIEVLWDVLKREADEKREGSSLIPLPHPYIVPGGRFNEIYYWDSYFTMLGLQVSQKIDLIENMVDNFSWLIDNLGFIPNGNRTYFLGRSQPPFYALQVSLLAEERGEDTFVKYLPYLEKEYAFWMHGGTLLQESEATLVAERVVRFPDGSLLNRYYDRFHQARGEMYEDDQKTAAQSGREPSQLFLDLRAACESGWDFSVRWLADYQDLGTIRASEILPVDLNCLLYYLESTLAKAHGIRADQAEAESYQALADRRKSLIHQYFWREETGFFHDYDFVNRRHTEVFSLAGMFPLFFKLATPEQAESCATIIRDQFLKPGGLVSTTIHSGQQWDAPNGWAPLQWISIQGLRHYGFNELADSIRTNWITLNEQVYQRTGKMLEKYNVEDTSLLSGGGEYPVQDGFGWTNGVLLRLLKDADREAK